MIIKTHKELAGHITNKRILHMNSLGKDSVLCLEWLTKAAKPSKIVSVFFKFLANHPDDERYFNYLVKRFPQVQFIVEPNAIELNLISDGVYQTPVDVNTVYNQFEDEDFLRSLQVKELKEKFQCDFICDGSSKYESFARRTKFHQKGLLDKGIIYPLGMMTRAEVVGLIKATGIKLHPCYKFSKGTYDHPSYWKMRAGLVTNKKYYENILRAYPLFVLDKYRYEVLLKEKK